MPFNSTDAAQPIFIHSAPRTSSTWFWARFRALPRAMCFYEPFNEGQAWLTHDAIAGIHHDSWNSRHPPLEPYYQEYAPLIGAPKGVRLFDPAMTMQWFVPIGGLRGALRAAETAYLSQLVCHAAQSNKTAVIGGWRTLGRAWAMKQALGGYHIFQHRNLWRQWLSFLSYKRKGDMTFYVTIMDTIFRDDEPYFQFLAERGLSYANSAGRDTGPYAPSPLLWDRRYVNVARDEEAVRRLELMPEHQVFALFMGLHIYLYLHAQLSSDLTADATKIAQDGGYRAEIETTIARKTGLHVSFADAGGFDGFMPPDFDTDRIDWDEIRDLTNTAIAHLAPFADPKQLGAEAAHFIDSTMAEMRGGTTESILPAQPSVRMGGIPRRQKICLSMIVKNEAPVIRRCLDSVRGVIDYWIIVDTGSTDGTQAIVRDCLHGLPGELHERPWVDFAHNRTEALEFARPHGDYTLVIDADDTLAFPPGFQMPFLRADSYMIEIRQQNRCYWRPQLVRNAVPWRYEGVLHEFLSSPAADPTQRRVLAEGRSQKRLAGVKLIMTEGGARRRLSAAERYHQDAMTLEAALSQETDPFLIARYTFYLAASYQDGGEKDKALEAYQRRAKLGYWDQEVFFSLYQAARLKVELGHADDEVIAAFLQAHAACTTRAEALHGASRYCRMKERFAQGFGFARRALPLKLPTEGLFVDAWVYEYGVLDEYAVNAYWTGHYKECLDACRKLLASRTTPVAERGRIQANADFAMRELQKHKNTRVTH